LKSLEANHNVAIVQLVGSVICSVWAFIFSINVFRLIFEYHIFARESGVIVNRSGTMIKSKTVNEREAYELMYDYQTARCMAPLIPSLIWKLHHDHLSERWAEFQR
jgi:hypothetical protein